MTTDGSGTADAVRVVAVATDGSGTAARAVGWAATLATAHGARLHVTQVLPSGTSAAECERSAVQLTESAQTLAPGATARVVAGDAIAELIVAAAEDVDADVLVVGNNGMRGRKEFLLGNVANRVTHLARCTVTVVNTGAQNDEPEEPDDTGRLDGRAREIARVLGPAVVRGLAGRALRRPHDVDAPQQLREAFETLGPTFGKLGQMLSTRPDLVAPEYVEELRSLQASVPPMSEAEVVAVMEQELGVPWEDVFGSIDPSPLAAGTIGQVHRASLADGRRVVVKVQRPGAATVIDQDLVLLGRVVSPLSRADRVRRVIDLPSVVDQLGTSLRSELDFRMEAENLDRMATSLERYDRLAVPQCHHGLSSSRLLVMDEVPGVPVAEAPAGPERAAAARQLLQAFYQQVLEEGFFHADPHPGNLMWADGCIWLIDLGMVGRLDADVRQQLMLLLLAFAQGDGGMLAEIALDLAGGGPPDLDRNAYEAALSELAGGLQGQALEEIQFAELLNRLTDLSMRFGVPLPASLVMVGKAVGQVQLTVAEIAPEIDPLAEAAHFFSRSLVRRLVNRLDPQELIYQAEKLRYRAGRVAEDFTGGRHAPPVTFAIERSLAHSVARSRSDSRSGSRGSRSRRASGRRTPPRSGAWRGSWRRASTAALAVEVTSRGVKPWARHRH